VISDELVPRGRIVATIPADLEALVHRCLREQAHDRYDSARVLTDDLERLL
jgi:hypothetical protein